DHFVAAVVGHRFCPRSVGGGKRRAPGEQEHRRGERGAPDKVSEHLIPFLGFAAAASSQSGRTAAGTRAAYRSDQHSAPPIRLARHPPVRLVESTRNAPSPPTGARALTPSRAGAASSSRRRPQSRGGAKRLEPTPRHAPRGWTPQVRDTAAAS